MHAGSHRICPNVPLPLGSESSERKESIKRGEGRGRRGGKPGARSGRHTQLPPIILLRATRRGPPKDLFPRSPAGRVAVGCTVRALQSLHAAGDEASEPKVPGLQRLQDACWPVSSGRPVGMCNWASHVRRERSEQEPNRAHGKAKSPIRPF